MKKVNIRNLFKIFLLLGISLFTLTSCGYKPSSYYAKKQMDGKVFVNLIIDLEEPKTAVLLKDTVNQLLLQKLDSKLVYDKKDADIIMDLKIASINMQELQYDEDGYNKLYRSIVNISIDYVKKATKEKNSINVTGEHNFSIDDGTTITDTKRFEAIENASEDALEDVLSKLAIISFKK